MLIIKVLKSSCDYRINDDNTDAANSHKKYFLPRVNIENHNIETDSKSFYDQPSKDPIKKNDEFRKTETGQVGCLLDYAYFDKNHKLIAVDLSELKALDADPRAIQQIVFNGEVKAKSLIYYILEQTKETVLKFYKGRVQ